MVQLIPVEMDYDITKHTTEPVRSTLEATVAFLKTVHAVSPWISYLAKVDDEFVGICSFKGNPADGKVEIAYFTFPDHEQKGYGTEMCRSLVKIAWDVDPTITITARTLPEENASTQLLKKVGFVLSGTVIDDEDGEVFEWCKWHDHVPVQETKR